MFFSVDLFGIFLLPFFFRIDIRLFRGFFSGFGLLRTLFDPIHNIRNLTMTFSI